MGFYQRHVFFCCNERAAPDKCCNNAGGAGMQLYAKQRVKELGLAEIGKDFPAAG